jgi:hypothetical protein
MENNKELKLFNQYIKQPFSVTFSWHGQYREVRLKNREDILKLADILEKILKDNNIECEIIESSDN